MNADIRWKQRLDNFKKALTQLNEFIEKSELNKFERQGLIQCFEYTFELGWKTLKDYLENGGEEVATPRAAIQLAFRAGIIKDGHTWIDALQKRNFLAHSYNEQYAIEAEVLIRTAYADMLNNAALHLDSLS